MVSLVFPVKRLGKLTNFRNFTVFVDMKHKEPTFLRYLFNDLRFHSLLSLAFEVIHIAEHNSDL